MTRKTNYGKAQGVRLDEGTWNLIDELAVKRNTSRGQEIRLLVGEALAARRESASVTMLEKKVDRILAWVLREEEAQQASLDYIKEQLRKEIAWPDEEEMKA